MLKRFNAFLTKTFSNYVILVAGAAVVYRCSLMFHEEEIPEVLREKCDLIDLD